MQTLPPDEVIVIRDEERRGPSWARNEGFRQSHCDLIAFTDDDCVPPENWLEMLAQAINRFDAAGAGGTYEEKEPILRSINSGKRFPKTTQIDKKGQVGTTGNIMYRRRWLQDCIEKDGYIFDERLGPGEDHELSWRLQSRGARFVFVPNPVAHERLMGSVKYLRFQFRRGVSICQLYRLQHGRDPSFARGESMIWGPERRGKIITWLSVI